MDGNRQEAEQACKVGQKALDKGDYEKALRMFSKAARMGHPEPDFVQVLIGRAETKLAEAKEAKEKEEKEAKEKEEKEAKEKEEKEKEEAAAAAASSSGAADEAAAASSSGDAADAEMSIGPAPAPSCELPPENECDDTVGPSVGSPPEETRERSRSREKVVTGEMEKTGAPMWASCGPSKAVTIAARRPTMQTRQATSLGACRGVFGNTMDSLRQTYQTHALALGEYSSTAKALADPAALQSNTEAGYGFTAHVPEHFRNQYAYDQEEGWQKRQPDEEKRFEYVDGKLVELFPKVEERPRINQFGKLYVG